MTDPDFLTTSYTNLRSALSARDTTNPLPTASALSTARASLPPSLPSSGLGPSATASHLLTALLPALSNQALTGRYFGFVTGGVLPVAEAADNLVSALDQNVQVHLPRDTVATEVEDAALRMLLDLLDLGPTAWPGRTFTTGATGSNVLGLACAREWVVDARLPAGSRRGEEGEATVARKGLLGACAAAGVCGVRVLTSMAHSSLVKAASVVGLGHEAVVELRCGGEEPWRLDLEAVEAALRRSEEEADGVVSVIVVSAGEVNTGRYATSALDMPKLRSLADRYGAWIHVDGAFGIFARVLPHEDEFMDLRAHTAGLELADSITVDGHKILNVPYDTGIFFCRHPTVQATVFGNPNAAYLAAGPSEIPSPLNIGLENSRRFRALPVYAVLLSEGRSGIAEMVRRMVVLARKIAAYLQASPGYDWLPDEEASLESTFIIVLFRAKDRKVNEELVQRLNASGTMYVSGTAWKGEKACRIAVSSWRVDPERDFAEVKSALDAAVGA